MRHGKWNVCEKVTIVYLHLQLIELEMGERDSNGNPPYFHIQNATNPNFNG
jgi:hypothetical protein